MLKTLQQQTLRAELQLLGIRLSDVLEMSEREYERWVTQTEKDPLFRLLRQTGGGARRVLRRKPWQGLGFVFQGLLREPAGPPSDSAAPPPIPDRIVNLIQRIGRERFERDFLHNEGDLDAAAIAKDCGLSLPETHAIQEFLDQVAIGGGIGPQSPVPSVQAPYQLIAAVETGEKGRLEISFLTAHYARGLYVIDYDALERLKRSGDIGPGEWRKVRELIRRIELINAKQTVLAGLLKRLLERQKSYLKSGDPRTLRPWLQKEAASDLEVAPSAVCRAIRGRSIRMPWGEEKPIESLFPSRRQVALLYVRDLLDRHPGLKDADIRERLRGDMGYSVSLRCANLYRHSAGGAGRRSKGSQ